MNIPKHLKYTRSHEWVSFEDDNTSLIGLTDHAQSELGDLVFVNLPEPGDALVAGETFADVESVKAASDVYSPVTATVAEINELLQDTPQAINEDPYGAWLVRAERVTGTEELLDADEYAAFVESETAGK